MFTNRLTQKDSLLDPIKAVMRENDIRREVESQLNVEYGVPSRKGLPHEMVNGYESKLNDRVENALNEGTLLKEDNIQELSKKTLGSYVK
ncbi:MAG: hypothetical protein WD512_11570, partial [Candidatus Paceibacterota bacterium]